MKILFIAPTPFFADRGTHIRIFEEARALEKRQHHIIIATYHVGRNIAQEVGSTIDIRRINRWLFWYKKLEAGPDWQKIILDLFLLRKVLWLTWRQRPDVIHGHLHEGVLLGWLTQKVFFWRHIPLVADFHGSLTGEMVSHQYLRIGFMQKIFQYIERKIDNLGDAAVASSVENKQIIDAMRKKNAVHVVLDGVHVDEKKSPQEIVQTKMALQLPLTQPIVVYAGALLPNKGIHYLLEAIPLVLAKKPETYFVIAGSPKELIVHAIASYQLAHSVKLISPITHINVPAVLSVADIAVDPKDSQTNQASGKILQYMGAGLPVVCFDRTNNRSYLGSAAHYATPMSAQGIADALLYYLDHPQERIAHAAANRERAVAFSWDVAGKQLEELYRHLCQSR
ncbi:MAG: glycosyltransferase family 4 protein [Candidatus Kerfeldbacteria bacterium]|nr:glycosyltransferase family 4 protein [Candidatus Kerfeldbacteria bacterium]